MAFTQAVLARVETAHFPTVRFFTAKGRPAGRPFWSAPATHDTYEAAIKTLLSK